ncbi:MAG: universal stress protein [Salinibacterium sp.]|nr:universal stress protein [Salinibacterium sp.]
MNDTILVAVNDSPAGFSAAEIAVDYARRLAAPLHAVTVVQPDSPELNTGPLDGADLADRREKGGEAVLHHVTTLAIAAGVEVTSHLRRGVVAAELIAEAREIGAGLIVMALVDRASHAIPYIGSNTLRVMEFATVPVLVVPAFHAES